VSCNGDRVQQPDPNWAGALAPRPPPAIVSPPVELLHAGGAQALRAVPPAAANRSTSTARGPRRAEAGCTKGLVVVPLLPLGRHPTTVLEAQPLAASARFSYDLTRW